MPPRVPLKPVGDDDSTRTIPPAPIAEGTDVTPADVANAGAKLRAMKVDATKSVSAVQVTTVKATTPRTMPTLFKLFGQAVIDIFPEPFRQAIDDAYKFWQEHPDSYLPMEADTLQQREEILVCMRAYAEIAPNGPYTIRTISHPDPLMIIWRAQNRRGTSGDDSTEGS